MSKMAVLLHFLLCALCVSALKLLLGYRTIKIALESATIAPAIKAKKTARQLS